MSIKNCLFCTIFAACGFFLSACSSVVYEEVYAPPELLKHPVRSVSINAFSGKYGNQLATKIQAGLQNADFVEVRTRGAQAVLQGTVRVGRVNSNSYSRSFKVTKKNDKGKKYKTTETNYYVKKKGTASVDYSLISGNRMLASNTHSAEFEDEQSGDSASEARADAMHDEIVIANLLQELTDMIVKDIAPHKTQVRFALQREGHEDLGIGTAYYLKGLYGQAEDYWQRLFEDGSAEPKVRAAAAYNLGVLQMRKQNFTSAYNLFSDADSLHPAKPTYMDALAMVEKAEYLQRDLVAFRGSGRGAQGYELTVTAPEGSRVRIMNIGPQYRPGMRLPSGRYDLLVEKGGFRSHREWITIDGRAKHVKVVLRSE